MASQSRGVNMRRREFLGALGGAARVAVYSAGAASGAAGGRVSSQHVARADATHLVTAFRQDLKEAGFVEGQNVAIEYRYADNQNDRLPALVADLIRRPVAVIVGNNSCGARGQGRNNDDADRLCGGRRPGQRRPRRQLE